MGRGLEKKVAPQKRKRHSFEFENGAQKQGNSFVSVGYAKHSKMFVLRLSEEVAARNFTKIVDTFPSAQNKVLSLLQPWGLGGAMFWDFPEIWGIFRIWLLDPSGHGTFPKKW